MDISNRRIVLTGAASGIGLALLQALVRENCRIVAADRDGKALALAVAPFEKQVSSIICDLSVPAEVDSLFDFAVKTLGAIDIFIANAGFAYYERLQIPDWDHLESIFRVNTLSPIYALLKMNELRHNGPWKTVIVSSAMAEWAVAGYSLYGGTKAALQRFADGYRFEGRQGSLAIVYPIATRTKFFEKAGKGIPVAFPLQRAETVASSIVTGIRKDRRHIYPSSLYRVMHFLNRILPFIRPLYQHLESRKFKKWLESSPS